MEQAGSKHFVGFGFLSFCCCCYAFLMKKAILHLNSMSIFACSSHNLSQRTLISLLTKEIYKSLPHLSGNLTNI